MDVVNVTIVGMGPRGISVIERLGAAGVTSRVVLHCVDSAQLGAGAVWKTDQTRTLCMNTLAGAVTLFTEPGASISGPVQPGPTMYEWIQELREDGDSPTYPLYDSYPAHAQAVAFSSDLPDLLASFEDELAITRPESNPSRALYGAYLQWCFEIALDRLPSNVEVIKHRTRAVSLTEVQGRDRVELADGSVILSDATVLALGWVTPSATAEETIFAAGSLPWVKPANPLEQDLSALPPASSGKKVLVRGMGMGFFDVLALSSIDRGGQFIADSTARGGLRYLPSGLEPALLVTSGRGYPFLPKSEYAGLPPVASTPAFDAVFEQLEGADTICFLEEVYPSILHDALAQDPEFDIDYWFNPLAGFTGNPDQLTAFIADSLANDIRQAEQAASSPLKNALWVISSVRKRVSMLGAGGRYSDQAEVSRFMKMGQMVGSGPPAFRSRQLLALVDAGLITFLGARPQITVQSDHWVVTSPTTEQIPVSGDVLVDAWMHTPNALRTDDPLLASLSPRMRAFAGTGSPETDPATRLLVNPAGELDPRILLIGIPTGGQHPDTTISPMPGTDPLFLQETDKAAQSILKIIGEQEQG